MRRWHRPIPLTPLFEKDVPDRPGVYVLLEDERQLASVVKIMPTRSLLRGFRREIGGQDPEEKVRPSALMYFETAYEAEEADRLLREYRRNNGRRPALNSPF